MGKAFNDLGKEGWELVSVTPISLDVKGEYSSSLCGIGDSKTEGKFEKISAYFNKEVQ